MTYPIKKFAAISITFLALKIGFLIYLESAFAITLKFDDQNNFFRANNSSFIRNFNTTEDSDLFNDKRVLIASNNIDNSYIIPIIFLDSSSESTFGAINDTSFTGIALINSEIRNVHNPNIFFSCNSCGPEMNSILGTGMAFGFGILFEWQKRKYKKRLTTFERNKIL